MAVSLLHATVATGTDAGNGSIHKAEWNQEHAITMATSRLLGRTTAGTGAVEEISAGAGLTLSAGVLDVGSVSLTTGVTGTLPVGNGGTGLTSGTSGGIPYYSSLSTLASSGVLTANALMVGGGAGVAPSTITTGTGVVTALGVNTGTAGAFVVNGGALGTPSSGTVTNLTGTASININGTVGATTPNTGAFTSVTSTSASGILTRAAATQDGVELIGRAGGTTSLKVTFTPTTLTASRTITLPDANINFTTGLGVAQGGTGLTSGTSGGVLYYSATGTLASSAALAANALVVGGGAGAAPSTVTTGTGVVTALGVNTGTAGAFVVNGGALGTPSSGTVTNLTGTASININGTVGATTANTGAFTSITATSASGIVSRAAATQDGVALIGRAGGTSGWEVILTPTTLTADRTLTLPNVSGTVLTTGTTVTVAQGGTGATTLTGILKGNGTSAFTAAVAGTDYLTTNQTITLSGDVSGSGSTAITTTLATVTAAKGGTGQTSYTVGDILYASTTSALSKLADVATGNALISGGVGVAPSYGKIGLTTHISGTLAVGNGGTGATTLTGVLKGNGTSAFTAAVAGTDYVIPSGDVASVNTYKCYGGVGTANASGDLVITFPAAFAATTTTGVGAVSTSGNYCVVTAFSTTGMTIQAQSRSAGTGVASAAIRWVAVGVA